MNTYTVCVKLENGGEVVLVIEARNLKRVRDVVDSEHPYASQVVIRTFNHLTGKARRMFCYRKRMKAWVLDVVLDAGAEGNVRVA